MKNFCFQHKHQIAFAAGAAGLLASAWLLLAAGAAHDNFTQRAPEVAERMQLGGLVSLGEMETNE